jgi:ElaB/YqjD/DUF883 family membrane-anchored ribosome-binding protein
MNADRARAEAEIERTTESLLDRAHQLEQRVSDAKERVERFVDPREQVHAHPWGAVGAAFALGFIVGWWS